MKSIHRKVYVEFRQYLTAISSSRNNYKYLLKWTACFDTYNAIVEPSSHNFTFVLSISSIINIFLTVTIVKLQLGIRLLKLCFELKLSFYIACSCFSLIGGIYY